MLAAGRVDGAVMVVDVRSPRAPRVITSTVVAGSHLQPVCQVGAPVLGAGVSPWGSKVGFSGVPKRHRDVLWCFGLFRDVF